jgi:MerR family transcriptional regulator, light-induced transcriptional regulator
MTELLFTTKDVADMLQVDKTTVKRWTDEGKLKCFRTPGGHRKFRAEDLNQFMSDFNYNISATTFFPAVASDEAIMRGMIARKEFNVLDSVCFSAAIKGNKNDVLKLFSETYKNGMSLPLMFDKILRPTVQKISTLHISGKLLPPEKQLAMNSLANAIVLLSDIIVKPSFNGKTVICAMVENDPDDLELKALAVLLESGGFEVLNLGVGTSADSIAQLARNKRPHFVFLIASSVHNEDTLADEHKKVQSELQLYGGKLIVGGPAYTQQLLSGRLDGLFYKFCSTFKELTMVQYEKTELKTKENE